MPMGRVGQVSDLNLEGRGDRSQIKAENLGFYVTLQLTLGICRTTHPANALQCEQQLSAHFWFNNSL